VAASGIRLHDTVFTTDYSPVIYPAVKTKCSLYWPLFTRLLDTYLRPHAVKSKIFPDIDMIFPQDGQFLFFTSITPIFILCRVLEVAGSGKFQLKSDE
jgi:hypothetical protein